MPAPTHRLIPIFVHLHLDVYRKYSGRADEEATRLGILLVLLLRHCSRHVTNSGGWLEILKLVEGLVTAGYDRARAGIMHANARQKHVQILGVALAEDPLQPETPVDDQERERATRRPPHWRNSFGDDIPDYVEGKDVRPLSIRPLVVRVYKGQSLRVICWDRIRMRYMPSLCRDMHLAMVVPLDHGSLLKSMNGRVAFPRIDPDNVRRYDGP